MPGQPVQEAQGIAGGLMVRAIACRDRRDLPGRRLRIPRQPKGVEVVVSGKLRAQRAKAMKFTDGYMIKTGHSKRAYIDAAVRHVLMRQGVLGVKVSIMLPHDATGKTGPKEPLADVVTILEPKEEAPAPAAPTFEDGLQKPPAAQPGDSFWGKSVFPTRGVDGGGVAAYAHARAHMRRGRNQIGFFTPRSCKNFTITAVFSPLRLVCALINRCCSQCCEPLQRCLPRRALQAWCPQDAASHAS